MGKADLATSGFTGFPDSVFTFLAGLEADNSREYWERNKATWTEVIQPTVEDLMADLEAQFGPLRTFRPNRDVRFSADKTPYKTWIGVTTSDRAVGGVGSFLRVDATGMRIACGAMAFAPDQVKEYRRAIDNAGSVREFDDIREQLRAKGYTVGPGKQPMLQRPPNGYPADHPRAELLRWKGAVIIAEFDRASWMARPKARDKVAQVWADGAPLIDWIQRHVGSSSTPARRPR